MSIEDTIASNCTDKSVYWESLSEDGYGGKTFADPIELDCRWENINQVVTDAKGEEITSRALVFITQDVEEEGLLYHGTLDDLYLNSSGDSYMDSSGNLDSDEYISPVTIEGVFIIKRFQKTPSLSGNGFLRKAYLTPSLSFGGF